MLCKPGGHGGASFYSAIIAFARIALEPTRPIILAPDLTVFAGGMAQFPNQAMQLIIT